MARSPGMMINDKVRLFEPLATGAMGEVWIAEHATLQTEVAVKFLQTEGGFDPSEATERFSIEAAASAKIRSPHVVQTFDHGITEDGTPYIVMELLEGETLGQRMASGKPLPMDVTLDVVTHVGKAIDAAHALGIVHRDIKPDNIFLQHTPDGETFAKVLDFGTAKQEYMSRNARLTAPGTLVGTPSYMSRDQIMDPDDVSPAMDRWALAVVAYRCLTGVPPFRGDGPAEVCAAIVEGTYTPPSQLRPELGPPVDTWFAQAVSRDPAARPGTGRALAAELRRAVGAPPAPTESPAPVPVASPTPPPPGAPPPPPTPGRPWPLLVGGLGVVLIGAGVALLVLPRNEPVAQEPTGEASAAPPASTPGVASSTATSNVGPGPASAAPAPSPPPPPTTPRAPEALLKSLQAARVSIPAGRTLFGCVPSDPHCDDDERPGGALEVPAYRIDRGEVTVRAFAACVEADVCHAEGLAEPTEGHPFRCNWGKPGRDEHPINCVDAPQAALYCAWAGGRLPSETEWARAARGDDDRILPWGAVFATCPFAVMQRSEPGCLPAGTRNVGSKAQGKSPFGVLHLAGNVSEWTRDAYEPRLEPTLEASPGDGARTVRGGSWSTATHSGMRISERAGVAPDQRRPDIGFRCVE